MTARVVKIAAVVQAEVSKLKDSASVVYFSAAVFNGTRDVEH